MGNLTGDLGGLAPGFLGQLQRMAAAAPGDINVTSGFRTSAEQAALYKAKPRLAAPPGRSKHEKGLAADLAASPATMRWVHAHAKDFGLYFPMSYEPWHIQPRDESGAGLGGLVASGSDDPGALAAGLSDDPGALAAGLIPPGTARRIGQYLLGGSLVIVGFTAAFAGGLGKAAKALKL